MKHKNIKIILISSLISIIIFYVGIFSINKINNMSVIDQTAQAENALKEIPQLENKTTTISFVGDIMLTRGVKSSVEKNFGGDYSKLFENIPELKNADILFGNLEGDVSLTGNNVGSIYSFRMDPVILPVLKGAGFDIVSFSNNHVGDWNIAAFEDTLSGLEENGILKTGADLNKEDAANPTIIEKNGTRFGFLGFSDIGPNWLEAGVDTPGILLASDPNLAGIIQNAKTKCDVLIVSFHWGEEYKLIHNKRQESLAHTAIDNGADMVIGHHPHVMEDVEEYNGKTIVYSLGNFIFDQYFSKDTMRGMLFSATYEGKNLVETKERIITLSNKYQPEGIYDVGEIEEKDAMKYSSCPEGTEKSENILYLDLGQEVKLPNLHYIPKNLKGVKKELSSKDGICLIKEAGDASEKMINAAKDNNLTIRITSGFRSYETQKIIFENALKKDEERAKISIAKPGYSEHQLGTAIDVTGPSIAYSSATSVFNGTPEDMWLRENSYLYGFVQSYPKGKEDITGYRYESWHYRYVGVENAKEIMKSDKTVNEFLKP